MTACFLALGVLLAGGASYESVHRYDDSVAYIDFNHVVNTDEMVKIQQLIFWEHSSDGGLVIVDVVYYPDEILCTHNEKGECFVTVIVPGKGRLIVKCLMFRYVISLYNLEVENCKICPRHLRRRLNSRNFPIR